MTIIIVLKNTTKFTVLKISDYNMDVAVPEAKDGVNSTVVVDLPEDATGTVTVEIDGEKLHCKCN